MGYLDPFFLLLAGLLAIMVHLINRRIHRRDRWAELHKHTTLQLGQVWCAPPLMLKVVGLDKLQKQVVLLNQLSDGSCYMSLSYAEFRQWQQSHRAYLNDKLSCYRELDTPNWGTTVPNGLH